MSMRPMSGPTRRGDASTHMRIDLNLQIACAVPGLPTRAKFRRWVAEACAGRRERVEVTIRIVDSREGQALNRDYRGRDYPTNVLSFPAEGVADFAPALLGDLVICAPVLAIEAAERGRALEFHWAHLVVHGCLHLLGFTHDREVEAAVMENLERDLLHRLGYPDPYAEEAQA